MRAAILFSLMLIACSKKPTFEEEFEQQATEIEVEAKKLEKDLKEQIELVPEAKEADTGQSSAGTGAE